MATDIAVGMQPLRVALEHAAQRTNEEWMSTLSPRKIAELEFHDRWRDGSDDADAKAAAQTNTKFYSTTRASQQYLANWIVEHSRRKVVLDYACGNGVNAIQSAKAGAALSIGLDISDVSVGNARAAAEEAGVGHNTYFLQGDCENTGLPDNTVDVVICNGMLHHLDLSFAFPELRRIMKPGGVCIAYEALAYNPLIKLYRMLTPALRTEWEKHHILSHGDLRFASRFFKVANVRHWHLASILATPFKKSGVFDKVLNIGDAVDSVLLSVFPFSRMAWIFTFELHKPAERS